MREIQTTNTMEQIKICNKYTNEVVGECSDGRNQNEGNQQLKTLRQQVGTMNAIQQNKIKKRGENLTHQIYTGNEKHKDCERMPTLNPRGIGPDDEEKVEMVMKPVIRHEIDGVSLSSPDRKWTLSKLERFEQKFRRINEEVETIASNSDQDTRTEKRCLPGGNQHTCGEVSWDESKRHREKRSFGTMELIPNRRRQQGIENVCRA